MSQHSLSQDSEESKVPKETKGQGTETFILASGNRHKYNEIARLLGADFTLVLQSDLGIQSPPETGKTFTENALIKARHASRESGLAAMADDSGLCVDALGQAPGVLSTRFAGDRATDLENNDKLRQQLEEVSNRRAAFHCVLLLLNAPDDSTPIIAKGVWHGEIATQPMGTNGFGYDPLFFIPTLGKTAAELTTAEKNLLSHRSTALRLLKEKLDAR